MSKYTTGELAKLCGVSVRTVQYYDSRNILIPSQLSEGGRRLYSQDDLRKLRIICFLRELDFSIDQIGTLFSEENSGKVIAMLVQRQELELAKELRETQEKLDKLTELKRALKAVEDLSVESLGDIAHMMKNQKKRRRMLLWMVALGLVMDVIQVGAVLYGVKTGIWWPLAVGLPMVVALGVLISRYYLTHVAYICPECHEVIVPRLGQAFWAAHTPNTRRLTCPHCGKEGFCVEIWREKGC